MSTVRTRGRSTAPGASCPVNSQTTGRPRPAPGPDGGPDHGAGAHRPGRHLLPAVDVQHLDPAVLRQGLPGTGIPADPARYDYRRAALDALHFPKLVDRLWQNLRRCAGFKVQYFSAVEAQRRLAPHLHAAIRGAIPRKTIRQVTKATYFHLSWPAFDEVRYNTDRLPVWDREAGGYCDPDTAARCARSGTPSTTPTPHPRTSCGSGSRPTSRAWPGLCRSERFHTETGPLDQDLASCDGQGRHRRGGALPRPPPHGQPPGGSVGRPYPRADVTDGPQQHAGSPDLPAPDSGPRPPHCRRPGQPHRRLPEGSIGWPERARKRRNTLPIGHVVGTRRDRRPNKTKAAGEERISDLRLWHLSR